MRWYYEPSWNSEKVIYDTSRAHSWSIHTWSHKMRRRWTFWLWLGEGIVPFEEHDFLKFESNRGASLTALSCYVKLRSFTPPGATTSYKLRGLPNQIFFHQDDFPSENLLPSPDRVAHKESDRTPKPSIGQDSFTESDRTPTIFYRTGSLHRKWSHSNLLHHRTEPSARGRWCSEIFIPPQKDPYDRTGTWIPWKPNYANMLLFRPNDRQSKNINEASIPGLMRWEEDGRFGCG